MIESVIIDFHFQNTTYAEVWESIDREWRYSKTYYQVKRKILFLDLTNQSTFLLSQAEFLSPKAAFPPPFRWIFYFAQAVYKAKKKSTHREKLGNLEAAAEKTNVRRKKKAYFVCLKEAILVKQQKDRDNTTNENLSIFKNDLLEQFSRYLNDPDNGEN